VKLSIFYFIYGLTRKSSERKIYEIFRFSFRGLGRNNQRHGTATARSQIGWLYYCYGEEEEMGTWYACVEIDCDRWCYGKDLEDIRARFCDIYGPDIEIPSILESPPEVETMHEMTGYDS
jgi:hypothetical protein